MRFHSRRLDHPNSLAHALHNRGICHQLGADRDATLAAAQRGATLAEKFGLMQWRACNLLLVGWATGLRADMSGAVRMIDAEIGNSAAVGPLPQYYLGLAAEVLLAAVRPMASRILTAPSPASTNRESVSFCRKFIGYAANACWRSVATTRTTRDRSSRPRATSPVAKAPPLPKAASKRGLRNL